MRKSIYTIYESSRCVGENELPDIFDDYFDTEKEPVPGYETDEYWQFNELVNCTEAETFWEDLKVSELNKTETLFLVTGHIGWYNSHRKIRPFVTEGIESALDECLGGNTDTCEVEYMDGSILVQGHHHDGCNWFEVRRLTEKGANKAADDLSRGKTIKPTPDWFRPLQTNEIDFGIPM